MEEKSEDVRNYTLLELTTSHKRTETRYINLWLFVMRYSAVVSKRVSAYITMNHNYYSCDASIKVTWY